jgi:hypothetical protein
VSDAAAGNSEHLGAARGGVVADALSGCPIRRWPLPRADQARTDFAAIESELEVIQKQLARLPTRRELAGTALAIIFATMMLTTLSLLFFLR